MINLIVFVIYMISNAHDFSARVKKNEPEVYLLRDLDFKQDKWLLIGSGGDYMTFQCRRHNFRGPGTKYYCIEKSFYLRLARVSLKGEECKPILETTYDAFISIFKNGKRLRTYPIVLQDQFFVITFYDVTLKSYRGLKFPYSALQFLEYSDNLNEDEYKKLMID